ncbi:MAG: hypothetical protein CMB80_03750 [Flammeovirgaceae bacterium]|nr:hypothetical protein [Flammeovirgaceae bacterium]|tara:strand:- start:1670 stop:5644 length:3975 start_codon:yes stop_codon:yes gene_type:complete
MARSNSLFQGSTLFSPSVIKKIAYDASFIKDQTAAALSGSNIDSTSSFKFDNAYPAGIKSTQQLPVDFSGFENHTFFNSAESKVNVAFDKIINQFPFDGTKEEIENFLDVLTGFEKYVFDKFPKHMGFLHFSGTTPHENPAGGDDTGGAFAVYPAGLGTYIKIKDQAGVLLPTLSKKKGGQVIIGPKKNSSISFVMSLFVPKQVNSNQIIVQKLSDKFNGLTIGLKYSDSTESCHLFVALSSGSNKTFQKGILTNAGCISASMIIPKGKFNNVAIVYDNASSLRRLRLFQSGVLKSESDQFNFLTGFGFTNSELIIGSGTMHITNSLYTDGNSAMDGQKPYFFKPTQTFSGAIDEFRVFDSARSVVKQKESQFKNIFASENLKLYFKFNEPSGSYPNNQIVLDSSGNSLHALVQNFSSSLRESKELGGPLKNERKNHNPVLFPYVDNVRNLNSDFLFSGSLYDANNPNLITKLIPPHYLAVAQFADGFADEKGTIVQPYATGSIDFPRGGHVGSAQIISMIVLTWAKFFDELKMFVDQFANLLYTDYNENDTIANQFLPFLGQYYGFNLPSFYSNANFKQYSEGENLLVDAGFTEQSLRFVQNQIWRRVLTNLPDVLQSKGTTHSIKAVIRAVGLNPDNNFRFREFGGAKSKRILATRRMKTDHMKMLNFSASLTNIANPQNVNYIGVHPNRPFIMSSFLSGSRTEVGFPEPAGIMVDRYQYSPSVPTVIGTDGKEYPGTTGAPEPTSTTYFHGISNDASDGLFTSGSFTYEAQYRFDRVTVPGAGIHPMTQSLMRLNVTGSATGNGSMFVENVSRHGVIFNLVVTSGTLSSQGTLSTGSLFLYARSGLPSGHTGFPGSPLPTNQQPTLKMVLTGVNLFDGNPWYVSWGRQCAYEIGSIASASYFLRAARQNHGELFRYYNSSTLYRPWDNNLQAMGDNDVLSSRSAYNTSGSFITIGSQSLAAESYVGFLNQNTVVIDPQARATEFTGKISQVRFWSKALTEEEAWEHVRNPKSVGVKDPLKNFNFTTIPSGSFERLRLDISMEQMEISASVKGGIDLFDFTQNFSTGTTGAPWRKSVHEGTGFTKNLFSMSGSGFVPRDNVFSTELFQYSYIDPKFDERSADNKIRVRSWQSLKNEREHGGVAAPSYSVTRSEEPQDDNRFLIENSIVQALNEDIINIFVTLDQWDNMIGNPELLFSEDYPDLVTLRNLYFNRLTGKIKMKEFFEFFRWFDDSIGMIIDELLPRKTNFLGVQFTIESHILERAKFRYDWADNYIPIPIQIATGKSGMVNVLNKYVNVGGASSKYNIDSDGIPEVIEVDLKTS